MIAASAASFPAVGNPRSGEFSLHFVRDRQKNEVDFLLVRGQDPLVLVEAKLAVTEPAPALIKMKRALGVPAVASAERRLAGLP